LRLHPTTGQGWCLWPVSINTTRLEQNLCYGWVQVEFIGPGDSILKLRLLSVV
jgi:hypothetical protein